MSCVFVCFRCRYRYFMFKMAARRIVPALLWPLSTFMSKENSTTVLDEAKHEIPAAKNSVWPFSLFSKSTSSPEVDGPVKTIGHPDTQSSSGFKADMKATSGKGKIHDQIALQQPTALHTKMLTSILGFRRSRMFCLCLHCIC